MGKDFQAPKRIDRKAWKKVQDFILAGGIYHHGNPTDLSTVRQGGLEEGKTVVRAFANRSNLAAYKSVGLG
jgi:hypothetical protein